VLRAQPSSPQLTIEDLATVYHFPAGLLQTEIHFSVYLLQLITLSVEGAYLRQQALAQLGGPGPVQRLALFGAFSPVQL
jgi:hypothetical protein